MVTAVTCKSAAINGDAAVVDGAAAAAAAAKKISKHRDLVLAANPDNRFAPFAVEEGGGIGTDAGALVDAIRRPRRLHRPDDLAPDEDLLHEG